MEGRQAIVSVDEFSYFVFALEQKELIVPIAVAAVIAVVLIIAVLVTAAACKKALKKTGMFAAAAGTSLLEAFDPAQSYVLIALTVLIAILVVIEIYLLVSAARKKKLAAEEAKRAELRAKRAAADPLRRFIRTDIGRGDVQPVKKDFSALVAASQVGGEENEQSIYTMATLARKMNTAKKTDSVVVDTDNDTVQTRTVHTSETARAVAETVQLQQALAEAAAVNVTQEVGRLRAEAAADEDAVIVIDGSQKAPKGGFKQIAASAARTFGEKFAEASAEAKGRINGVIAVAHEYGLRSRESRKHLGVFCGRRLIAKVVFRGKTPCVAFALDPSEYAGTKYRGVDMSRYKTYARTPMMIKLTSQRRSGYAEHLARALFSAPDIRRR